MTRSRSLPRSRDCSSSPGRKAREHANYNNFKDCAALASSPYLTTPIHHRFGRSQSRGKKSAKNGNSREHRRRSPQAPKVRSPKSGMGKKPSPYEEDRTGSGGISKVSDKKSQHHHQTTTKGQESDLSSFRLLLLPCEIDDLKLHFTSSNVHHMSRSIIRKDGSLGYKEGLRPPTCTSSNEQLISYPEKNRDQLESQDDKTNEYNIHTFSDDEDQSTVASDFAESVDDRVLLHHYSHSNLRFSGKHIPREKGIRKQSSIAGRKIINNGITAPLKLPPMEPKENMVSSTVL